ncbi:helix-turn-helix domain-containing protein [Staphylococcus chromogenes]|uniref:helix-turn-helix domain-containing protein n=1 Tax=Staphylococcus chromogenes TaxID=46126 RepID=UPI002B275A2B|nr:helix-turn-helix domain-containing protein [Staphylococcus chromogenes]
MTKMGRPDTYEKQEVHKKLAAVEGWKRDGLSDAQIAKNLGVSRSSIKKWKETRPEFYEAISKGKEVSDYELENALHKRAVGFHYTEESVTHQGEVVQVTKYEPPNTPALIFALKNRVPHKYRDKVEQDIVQRNIEIKVGEYGNDDTNA